VTRAGAQIRDGRNMIVVPHAVPRGSLVKYHARHQGRSGRVWILSPQEAAQPDPRSSRLMAGKLFIRTFGCQMNEYDSEKISDVLARPTASRRPRAPRSRRHRLQHLLGAREGAGEGFRRPRPRQASEARQPALMIAVGGCVASQEGGAIVARAPYVDVVFGPQRRCTACPSSSHCAARADSRRWM
jgi:tRNA-2-methylthio-N6-dimethylallyladenosine synthase